MTTHVGGGSAATSTTSTTATPGLPAGLADNDILIAVAIGRPGDDLGTPPTITAPTGWTLIGTAWADVASTPRDEILTAWLHVHATGETAPTFTFPSSFVGDFRRGYVLTIDAYRGIIRPGLASDVATYGGVPGTTTFTPPAPTATRTSTPFSILGYNAVGAPTISSGTGWTRDDAISAAGYGNASAAIATGTDVPAGTVTMPTWATGGTTNTVTALSFTLATEARGIHLDGSGMGPVHGLV